MSSGKRQPFCLGLNVLIGPMMQLDYKKSAKKMVKKWYLQKLAIPHRGQEVWKKWLLYC